MNTLPYIALTLTLFLLIPGADQMISGDRVVIREKANQDLYIAGGTVTVNAPVDGDLIMAGGTLTISDTVTQDILALGGTIVVDGFVGDDIRCAGGTVVLSNEIKGDVIVAGGTIHLEETAIIMGNLISAGGEIIIDGEIKGYIRSTAGTITLNGRAGDDVHIKGGRIAINGSIAGHSILAGNKIELGPNATFANDVVYWNKEGELDFRNAMTGGSVTFDPSLALESDHWYFLGFASVLILIWYLGTALLMIFLIQFLFGHFFKKSAKTVFDATLKSLGWGILFLVGVPVLIMLSMATIIGLPLGMVMLMIYITLILFATVIVSLLAAHWVNNIYYRSAWGTARLVFTAFGIFVVLKLVSLTPFIGPLIMLLMVCLAFGALISNIKWRPQSQKASI